MKKLRNISLVVCLFTLSSLMVFASENAKKQVSFDKTTKVGTLTLKPGDYTLKWDDSSTAPQVHVLQNDKEVGTVPATLQKQGSKSAAYEFTNSNNDSQQLTHVFTKNETLEFSSGS